MASGQVISKRALRRWTMVIALFGASTGCAAGEGWTRRNTALELGFAGELAIDAYQTDTSILPTCTELNPVVGRCGERVPLAAYMPVGFALHAVIAWLLPPRVRDVFQALSVGSEGFAVGLNWSTQPARDRLAREPAAASRARGRARDRREMPRAPAWIP